MNDQNSLAYAKELLRVYWMGLRNPRAMNRWGDALQAVIKHDFTQCNMEGYLIVRHNETGIIHFFSDFNLKMSVKRDIKRGIYSLIANNVRVETDPTPLTMDRLIPFVILNWTDGVSNIDNTNIPSPLAGYVPNLADLVGTDRLYHTITQSMSAQFDDFKLLGDYVIGFLRLKTNDIKDGIEYAYLYHGGEYPSKGLHVYLSWINNPGFQGHDFVIDSQQDFLTPNGELLVPNAEQNLRIWSDHVLKGTNTSFTEMYSPFEPSKVNKPFYDSVQEALAKLAEFTNKLETYSYDTHKPFEIQQIIEPKYWNTDESWQQIIKKGMGYYPEDFGDPAMNELHKSLSGGKADDLSIAYLDLLGRYDTVITTGMAPDHKAPLPVAETMMQFLEQQDTDWVASVEDFIPDSDYKALAKDIVTIYANHLNRSDTVAMISNHIMQAEASGIKVSDITKAVYHYVTEAEPVYPDEDQEYPIG